MTFGLKRWIPLPFACTASINVFSNDGASREEIEDLREVCFDLWPEEMDTSEYFEEAGWSDGVEPMDVDEEEKKVKTVRWADELVVSQEFELTPEERDEKTRRIYEIHGKIDEIRFYSTPLTSFTPSRLPSLGSSKKIGRDQPQNPNIQLDQVATDDQSSPLPFACTASINVFSNDGASREEIEDLREVCFDLWPEEMDTSAFRLYRIN